MKQFKVFRHPLGTVEAVKLGWSWPAFFFGFIWALIKKLWLVALGLVVAGVIFGIIISALSNGDEDIAGLLQIIANVAVGVFAAINGNNWRKQNLISRGFIQVGGVVSAANPEGATALVLQGQIP